MTIDNNLKVSLGAIVICVGAFASGYKIIESKLNTKLDKEIFNARMELKDERLSSIENLNDVKILQIKEDVKENKETLKSMDNKLDILLGGG